MLDHFVSEPPPGHCELLACFLTFLGLKLKQEHGDDRNDDEECWVLSETEGGCAQCNKEKKGLEGGEGGGCIQEEAENLPDTTAMPEGAEYRREQRLERERGEAGGEGCCLAERSGGVRAPAWGGRGPKWGEGKREERQKNSQKFKEEVRVSGKTERMKKKDDERRIGSRREVGLVEFK